MSVSCNYCGKKCKNTQVMKKHQSTTKYCYGYKHITFYCSCGYTTIGIKNIDRHVENCKGDNTRYGNILDDMKSQIEQLTVEKQLLYTQNTSYKNLE